MIQAKIVADSINIQGDRLTTLEVVMPRYILAEFNTHRMLSKNSASSRAIPFSKMVKEIEERPFIPYAWQKDHKGMQGTEYLENSHLIEEATRLWLKARDNAVMSATLLNGSVGGKAVTKQLVNRLLEPFMYHKVLVSATEWQNFFNLRCPSYTFHDNDKDKQDWVFKSRKEAIKMLGENELVEYTSGVKTLKELTTLDWLGVNTGQADIHMMILAEAIYDAIKESTPTKLKDGEWHIPYGDNLNEIDITQVWTKLSTKENVISITELKAKISIARCARLSYQTLGDNPVIDYEADLKLYDTLYNSGHASPAEHIARAMTEEEHNSYVKGKASNKGTDLMPMWVLPNEAKGWCRNYRGFIMYRELLD